jgi:hypothetical protein
VCCFRGNTGASGVERLRGNAGRRADTGHFRGNYLRVAEEPEPYAVQRADALALMAQSFLRTGAVPSKWPISRESGP